MSAANEITPLIASDKPTTTPVPDEENGISLHNANSSSNAESTSRTSRRANDAAANDNNPTWSEAFRLISPYLLPNDRKHALLALSSLLLVLLEKLVNVLPPLAIRHAVDAISSFSSSSDATSLSPSHQHSVSLTVSLSILTYFLLTSLTSLLSSLQTISQRTVSLRAELLFSTALFSHLHLLGPSYHLERHAGELLRVLSRGSDAISTIIDALCFNLFPTLFEAAVVGTVFWKLLGIPSIAFTTVGAVACYLAYTLRMTNVRIGQRRKVLEKSEEVGRIETETLVNYETVVMFGREEREVEEYRGVRKEYLGERVNMLGLFAWLQLGQQTIRLAGTCLGLYLAGQATIYGTDLNDSHDDTDPLNATTKSILSPGSFVVVQLYIQQLFQPLSLLGFTYRQVSEAFTDLEKAVKMLQSEPAVKDAEDAVDWDAALKLMRMKHETSETDAFVNGHVAIANKDASRNDNGGIGVEDKTATIAGDIVFNNVSFRYKVKSHRKTLGGPDTIENGNSRGRRGRGGIARKGMWGNRGRGVWSGNGGANFWLRDASSKTASNINNNNNNNNNNPNSEDEESIEKMGGIQNVSFHIPAGKVAALVGKSGSGKTTIVRLILRMYDPDEGSVFVDGIDVKSLKQQSLRSNIGVVAQDTVLFHASLRDNITYGKEDATEEEIWEAVRITALEPLVKSLPDGLDTLVGERGMKLSGGERQRVGLARCIIKQPKICLLDEATSALDSGTEKEIQKNILTRQTAAAVVKGRTTLMIAHRLSTARRADVILVLEKGRVVERGTHDELLARGAEKGMYAKMWRDQMGGDSLDEL